MGNAYNINAKTKPCRCGRDKIYTSPEMTKYNAVVDGIQVCNECKIDSLYAKIGR